MKRTEDRTSVSDGTWNTSGTLFIEEIISPQEEGLRQPPVGQLGAGGLPTRPHPQEACLVHVPGVSCRFALDLDTDSCECTCEGSTSCPERKPAL